MPLGRDAVEKVFLLSRITPGEGEIERFATQLDAVLEYMETLNRIDTSQVDPVGNITDLSDVFREDTPGSSMDPADVLGNAPVADEESFKVPKVF